MPQHNTSPPHQVKLVDAALFHRLCQSAQKQPRSRSHFNLHDELDDPFQRMIVAIEPESYIRPHRHLLTPKPETLLCLRGQIGIVLFEDDGRIARSIPLAPGGDTVGCDIPGGTWHTIVSLQTGSVFLEAKPGPYVPFEPADFAAWAPDDGSDESRKYLLQIQQTFPR